VVGAFATCSFQNALHPDEQVSFARASPAERANSRPQAKHRTAEEGGPAMSIRGFGSVRFRFMSITVVREEYLHTDDVSTHFIRLFRLKRV